MTGLSPRGAIGTSSMVMEGRVMDLFFEKKTSLIDVNSLEKFSSEVFFSPTVNMSPK